MKSYVFTKYEDDGGDTGWLAQTGYETTWSEALRRYERILTERVNDAPEAQPAKVLIVFIDENVVQAREFEAKHIGVKLEPVA